MSLTTTLPFSLSLHRLTPVDVPSLHHVQIACYGDEFLESCDVFVRRLACDHHCSIGLIDTGVNSLQAYAIAYWSELGKVTPLHGDFERPENLGHILYLHDVAVLPSLSGQGVVRRMLQVLFAHAGERGVTQAALVSVQGSQGYWERQGFRRYPLTDPVQQKNLSTYGDAAVYMVLSIGS